LGSSPTIDEVIAEYLASLPADARASQQQELSRFVRWFGLNPSIEQVTGINLETYQQQLERSGADLIRHLEPVKAFVQYSWKKGYLPENIAKLIKFKKVTSKGQKSDRANSRVEKAEEIQLTKEGLDQIQAELDYLINEVRPQAAHELFEARIDKDFRENAPYDAAKQHQAHVEARIRELERILATATLIEENHSGDKVGIGSVVVLHDMAFDETVKYTLVSSSEADPKAGKISVASPVGKALLDRSPGEVVEVSAPAGIIHYRIERIER